jgi:hypothetical protein
MSATGGDETMTNVNLCFASYVIDILWYAMWSALRRRFGDTFALLKRILGPMFVVLHSKL